MMEGVFRLLSQPSSYHPQTRLCFSPSISLKTQIFF